MNAMDFAAALFAQVYAGLRAHLFQWPECLAFLGNFLILVAYFRKTMIPLRIIAIASNIALIAFAYLVMSYPILIANLILLPLNIKRLREMMKLIKRVETAVSGDFSLAWLNPFLTAHRISAGTLLFSKGETAESLFLIVSGRYVLEETGIEIKPGAIVGELGMLSPDRKRTQSLRCVEAGEIRSITYNQVEQLYFQNPAFGFYFLRLASQRLFVNLENMERRLAALSASQGETGASEMQAAS
jgi:CRP-like cAMP-binding protein